MVRTRVPSQGGVAYWSPLLDTKGWEPSVGQSNLSLNLVVNQGPGGLIKELRDVNGVSAWAWTTVLECTALSRPGQAVEVEMCVYWCKYV